MDDILVPDGGQSAGFTKNNKVEPGAQRPASLSRGLSHTRRESFDTFELTRDDEMAVASRTSRIAERFKRKKKKDSELDEIAKGFFPDQPDD